MILSGEMPPGTRLVEIHLGEQFGVSRTPVREALKRLTAEKLVLGDPVRGLVVHAPDIECPTTTGRSTASALSSSCSRAGTCSTGTGAPRLSPCAGRSIAMLRTAPPRRSMIGRQLRRSNVNPCNNTAGVPAPSSS
jgi:hypothetical protein